MSTNEMDDNFASLIDKNGMVNCYKEGVNIGSQPTRILHHFIIVIFQQAYPDFNRELSEQIGRGALNPELKISDANESVMIATGRYRTPRLNIETKQIELHESFLSFLWCSIYSIYILYAETVDYPKRNKYSLYKKYFTNEKNVSKAKELFAYAKFLVVDYKEWDKKELPNPEYYHPDLHTYIWQVNSLYSHAVAFILCHEFTHIKYHIDQLNSSTTNSDKLRFEREADTNAIVLMKKGLMLGYSDLAVAQRMVVEIGIILGLLSMFFLSDHTASQTHPTLEDRLTNALESLPLLDEESVWEMACLGLQLWDEQFNLQFVWNENESAKDQFYAITEQIKLRNKGK